MNAIESLKPESLESAMKSLLATERETQAQFLLHLAEFDRRRGFEAHGYATLWQYCVKVLRMSENQAHYRTEAARLVQRFSLAAEFLTNGRLCMTNLVQLRQVLTSENCAELLERAAGKSKDDVLRLVASLKPTPVPDSTLVRRVPDRPTEAIAVEIPHEPAREEVQGATLAVPAQLPMPKPPGDAEVLPVSAAQYRIRMLVDRAFVDILEESQSVLSHSIPDGDVRKVIAQGLRMILDAAAKRHDPNAVKQRKSSKPIDENSRHIPAELLRRVWARDKGCCVWATATGPCGSTHQLEVDHILAIALGGKTILENLQLVCRAHNQMHARHDFGVEFIDGKVAGARSERIN